MTDLLHLLKLSLFSMMLCFVVYKAGRLTDEMLTTVIKAALDRLFPPPPEAP